MITFTRRQMTVLMLLPFLFLVVPGPRCAAQEKIDLSGFQDGSHHWYDIEDEDKVIKPLPNQPRYKQTEIRRIADNILLYQKSNGGWPKNYDMLAILMPAQKKALERVKNETNTTFDNGATHSQMEFLAKMYQKTKNQRYRDAFLRGLDFVLGAQYANGGWPQFYPDTSGYRKYITFNDGARVGVMTVLHHILQNGPDYAWVDDTRRELVRHAFARGLDCILKCQVVQDGNLTAWGQQHDNVDLRPQSARNFEPASLAGRESAEIVLFLMSIDKPEKSIVTSINAAVRWFQRSKVSGIRVKAFKAPLAHYKYRTVDFDKMIVDDPEAPPIWARMYELGTNTPLFCNRDMRPVYALAEVERERRVGYSWYGYEPAQVLKNYPAWQTKWSADDNVLAR